MRKDAVISQCGQYRYLLMRVWDSGLPVLIIIMLNPSTADALLDDPTIRRGIAFARREGFGGIIVINLCAFRATQPDDMKKADDPIGPINDDQIRLLFELAASSGVPVLAAWGANGTFRNRDTEVRLIALETGVDLVCLGTTKDGHPRHPLYVAGDQPLVPFG